jgi:hypothetical protein
MTGCSLPDLCHWHNFPLQPILQPVSGNLKVVMRLEVEPALGVSPEELRQPQGSIRRDGSLSGNNFPNSSLRNTDGFCQPVLSDPEGLQEILDQNLSGVNRRHISFHHLLSSMVINDLDILRSAILPDEKYSPPFVDPDAPLPLSIVGQPFESIPGRDTKKLHGRCSMELCQFSQGSALNGSRQLAGKLPREYLLSLSVLA